MGKTHWWALFLGVAIAKVNLWKKNMLFRDCQPLHHPVFHHDVLRGWGWVRDSWFFQFTLPSGSPDETESLRTLSYLNWHQQGKIECNPALFVGLAWKRTTCAYVIVCGRFFFIATHFEFSQVICINLCCNTFIGISPSRLLWPQEDKNLFKYFLVIAMIFCG